MDGKALMLEEEVSHGVFRKYFEHLNTFDRGAFIDKRTYKHKGALLLKADDVHLMALEDSVKSRVYEGLHPLFNSGKFEHLVFEDAAHRIAGTGSLGLNRYCVLCYSKKKGKRYLVDVKEARNSCLNQHIKVKQPRFRNEAERVNRIGYIMQFNSPAYSATTNIDGKWYVVKEMQLLDDKMALTKLDNDFGSFSAMAKQMAVLMAYAHIRSSGHYGASTIDDLKRFAEKKQWQKDILDLCGVLAKKNNKYYKEFMKVM